MPALLDPTGQANPYVVVASTKRSPAADAAGRVGVPVTKLTNVLLHIVQMGPEITTERAGAIPYFPFQMETVGGGADILVSDQIIVSSGPFQGTYRARGVSQFGADRTQLSCERFIGT